MTVLHRYPMVTLQIRNKYHPDVWSVIRPHLEQWIHNHPTQCIVNGSIFPHISCGRHLPESQIDTFHLEPGHLVGTSIHSLEALDRSAKIGSHYVQYGAIFPTSKPVTPVGVDALYTICQHSNLPVLAVGGIRTIQHVKQCLSVGAHGISVGSWILRSEEPMVVIEQIVEEIAMFMSKSQ